MKNLTDQAVIDIAKGLIAANGKTTTLEVKQGLRNDGFFATQSEVSMVLDSLYHYEGLEFANNGMYREYFLAGAAPASVIGTAMITTAKSFNKPVKVPSTPAVEVATPSIGDWKVFENGTPNNCKYYASGCSRNAARYAFAKGSGFVHYPDTRTCIVS